MRIKFPGLQIAGVQDGFFQESEDNDIIALINQSGAEILFVALGSPKQELWLEKYKEVLKPSLRMGVGGTFDVMADQVKRAPKWMQENSLEWLYRAIGQPSRWKRLMALPKFVLAIKKAKKMDNHS
jgi:N-acetylglucosaminyldiphosphoundecaprenol N-acetyl-beta-D-mannosaminyltransferase